MDRILIRGGVPLSGTIPIGGAKNAALPLMAASLLPAEPLVLANLPDLADVRTMANLLVQHGVAITIPDSAADQLRPRARIVGAAHHLDDRAIRSGAQDARLGAGPRAAWWRGAAAAACRCPAAARSARGRSICTSRACSGSAPRSS